MNDSRALTESESAAIAASGATAEPSDWWRQAHAAYGPEWAERAIANLVAEHQAES